MKCSVTAFGSLLVAGAIVLFALPAVAGRSHGLADESENDSVTGSCLSRASFNMNVGLLARGGGGNGGGGGGNGGAGNGSGGNGSGGNGSGGNGGGGANGSSGAGPGDGTGTAPRDGSGNGTGTGTCVVNV